MGIMKDKIVAKINSREWKFHELLKLKEVANLVAEEIYQESNTTEQLQLVWEMKINGEAFGALFKNAVMQALNSKIMTAFQEKFESATVNFEGNPMPEPMPIPPPPTDNLEDLMQGKDVIEEPSLEEKDGKVGTRAGNVKVKRL